MEDFTYTDEIDGSRVDQTPDPMTWQVREIPSGVTDNELVPDDVIGELVSIRDQVTSSCFRIGDIANDMVSRAAQMGFTKVTAWQVRRAVGRFCGKSERTVRYYAEVSAFYPANVRKHYEILPFSHFVFARTLAGEWKEVLEYSMLKPEVTVEELRYHFLGPVETESSPVVSRETPVDSPVEAGKCCEGSQIGGGAAKSCEPSQNITLDMAKPGVMQAINACGDVLSAITRLEGAMKDVELTDYVYNRFVDISSDFRDLVSDIAQKLAR